MYIYDNSPQFLGWEMLQTEAVEKIKADIWNSINFLPKIVPLWDNLEKYDRTGQVTDDSIIRRIPSACWITKATNSHSEYVIVIAFLQQQWLLEGDRK